MQRACCDCMTVRKIAEPGAGPEKPEVTNKAAWCYIHLKVRTPLVFTGYATVLILPIKVRNTIKHMFDSWARPTTKWASFLSHPAPQTLFSSLLHHPSSKGWTSTFQVHEPRAWLANGHQDKHRPFHRRDTAAGTYLHQSLLQQACLEGLPQAVPKGDNTTGGGGCGQQRWSTIKHLSKLLQDQFNEHTLARRS